jgi:hypothetical protein
MTKSVIYPLEVIEINHCDRESSAVLAGCRNLFAESPHEAPTIQRSGQIIEISES